MLPWVHLGTAIVPGGGGELRLMQRGTEFVIMAGRIPLMNSRMSGSEEALATLSWDKIAKRSKPHLLIGGLGMGFTLRKALAIGTPETRVTVAELVPEVVEWAKGPLDWLFAGSLDDARAEVKVGDVGAVIAAARGTYDAILLDVDNGPDGLSRPENDRLYSNKGLGVTKAALKPGGVLAVWASEPDADFTRRLANAGFRVDEQTVRERSNGKGARHTIWLATKP
ncbi:MAG: spermidine synthase [Hyphomicrobiales bacterium]|nr:MAG: spermidine synthase [Hyphomicrobiales bacterium]